MQRREGAKVFFSFFLPVSWRPLRRCESLFSFCCSREGAKAQRVFSFFSFLFRGGRCVVARVFFFLLLTRRREGAKGFFFFLFPVSWRPLRRCESLFLFVAHAKARRRKGFFFFFPSCFVAAAASLREIKLITH